MYTHILVITLLTPWYMWYHYIWLNDEWTHMCYW